MSDIEEFKQPAVFARGKQVFTNSCDVAKTFGKDHRNVLRNIDNLIESLPNGPLLNFEQGSV